jgi:hypothetical protein
MNKRGAELITVIIWLVIGVLVATFLIIGFTRGWGLFTAWFSPGNNVDTIINQCQVACATNSVYGYCTMERTLKAEDLPNKQITDTCENLAKNYPQYEIPSCPGLCPPSS